MTFPTFVATKTQEDESQKCHDKPTTKPEDTQVRCNVAT